MLQVVAQWLSSCLVASRKILCTRLIVSKGLLMALLPCQGRLAWNVFPLAFNTIHILCMMFSILTPPSAITVTWQV